MKRFVTIALALALAAAALAEPAAAGSCEKKGGYLLSAKLTAAHGGFQYFDPNGVALSASDLGFRPRFLYFINAASGASSILVQFEGTKPSNIQSFTLRAGEPLDIECSKVVAIWLVAKGAGNPVYLFVED